MIPVIIVDDEENNRDLLKTLLKKHCPDVLIAAEAANAEEAFIKIKETSPALVFLDIQMPKKSGFDLLKMFSTIPFEVIFVTAHDNYAINAFEFNAIGYILKPIIPHKLVSAIEKARNRFIANGTQDVALHFVKTLSEKNNLMHKFSVHHNGKVVFIGVSEVAFLERKENTTTLNLSNGSHYYSGKEFQKFETVLQQTNNFIRINKNIIINTDFLQSYSKGVSCLIEMKDGQTFEVSRRRKSEILKTLKDL